MGGRGGEVTTGVDVLENISCICPDSGLRSSIACLNHCVYYAKLNEADSLRVRMKDLDLQLCPLWTYCMWFDEVVSHFWELYQFWERTWLVMLSWKAVCHLLRNESGGDFHFSTGFAPRAPVHRSAPHSGLPVGSLPRRVNLRASATCWLRVSVNLLDLPLCWD